MVLAKLPGWITTNDASVLREVAPFRGLSMAQRWDATMRCCRASQSMLRFHSDPPKALSYRDPLPASSVRALRRLRAAMVRDAKST